MSALRSTARLWLQLWSGLDLRDRRRLGWAVLAMLVGSISTAFTPVLVGRFVDAVFVGGHSVGMAQAVVPLGQLAGALAVISIAAVVQHQLVHLVTTGFQASARKRIYGALMRWDLSRYVHDARGAIYGRANRSVEGAERLIKLGAADLLPAVLVSVSAVALALARYQYVGLVMALVIPTGFALVAWQIRSQDGVRRQVAQAKERIDGKVSAWLGLLDVIRTTGTEGYFDHRVGEECDRQRTIELRHHIAMSWFDAAKTLNELLWLVVTMLAVLGLGASTSAGDLAGIVLLYLAMIKPLKDLHRVLDEAAESALQARDLQDDLARPWDASFSAAAAPSTLPPTGLAIELVHVGFAHADGRRVLDDLSLRIPTGQRVGLVGASGSGKSTLLKLLARLAHDHDGTISVGGRPLETLDRAALATRLGYVGQSPQLFQGSVRDNLVLGRAGITDTDLVTACRRASVYDEVVAMGGFDAEIGEDGGRLSGGQRQRLCLARALLRTPPIMLMDEPTSALDGRAQASVQDAIDQLDDLTLVVVAHRLATLRKMDRIVVMHDGRIVEDGTFGELVARGGQFAQMLAAEMSEPAMAEAV